MDIANELPELGQWNVAQTCRYNSEVPGSIPGATEVVGLERGPLSLVRVIEELLESRNSGSGLENRH
jgi:hypothetical protein